MEELLLAQVRVCYKLTQPCYQKKQKSAGTTSPKGALRKNYLKRQQ